MTKLSVLALVAAVTAFGMVAAVPAVASGTEWSDLRDEVVALVSDTGARAALVSAVDDIEYQELNGTDSDIVDAYEAFAISLATFTHTDQVSDGVANALLACMKDVSLLKRVKITGATLGPKKRCDANNMCAITDPKDCIRITMDGAIPVLCIQGQ